MKRLKIAIDCDDVLVESVFTIVEMYNRQYGAAIRPEGAFDPEHPGWQASSHEEIVKRIHDIQRSPEYADIPPVTGAIEAVHRLAKQHDLYLVTARPQNIEEVTSQMLEKYYPGCFKEVIHAGDEPKGAICSRLAIDVLIDDNLFNLVSAAECAVAQLIWLGDYPWQVGQSSDLKNLIKVGTWDEIQEVIDKLSDGK